MLMVVYNCTYACVNEYVCVCVCICIGICIYLRESSMPIFCRSVFIIFSKSIRRG